MKMPEILATIKSLAKSQGFYSRLYEHILQTRKVDTFDRDRIEKLESKIKELEEKNKNETD